MSYMYSNDVGDAWARRIRPRAGLFIWLGLFFLSSVARAENDKPYLIQPGDILQVMVWKEAELQAELLVRPDGGISFPLAGDLQAADKTVADVSAVIKERVGKFVPNAVVTVAVKVINGNRVYVVGKVNRPGEFPFSRPIDVVQALSLAGGATSFASVGDIRILRREGDAQTAIRFDYTDIEKGRALESNIILRSGDTVVVP